MYDDVSVQHEALCIPSKTNFHAAERLFGHSRSGTIPGDTPSRRKRSFCLRPRDTAVDSSRTPALRGLFDPSIYPGRRSCHSIPVEVGGAS
jgi:hypothetical protein